MRTILLILFAIVAIPVLAQDRYLKENDIKSIHIDNGNVKYDTLGKGVGVAYKFIVTYFGIRDTTKQIVVKYEAFQIDAVETPTTPPVTQVIDSEDLTYTGWARHGATTTPDWYDGTISYSTAGEAMYTFTGTGVEIWGETSVNHGTGTVSIGTQSKTASWQSDVRKLPAKVVEFKGLPRGQHTVVIKPVSGMILVDFLVVTK